MTWPHRGKVQLASDNTHLADLRTLPMPRADHDSERAIRPVQIGFVTINALVDACNFPMTVLPPKRRFGSKRAANRPALRRASLTQRPYSTPVLNAG